MISKAPRGTCGAYRCRDYCYCSYYYYYYYYYYYSVYCESFMSTETFTSYPWTTVLHIATFHPLHSLLCCIIWITSSSRPLHLQDQRNPLYHCSTHPCTFHTIAPHISMPLSMTQLLYIYSLLIRDTNVNGTLIFIGKWGKRPIVPISC